MLRLPVRSTHLYIPALLTIALISPTIARSQSANASVANIAARQKYTAADVAFMQGMIGHHAQALEMTALIATHSTRKDMALLGERISVSQRDEIRMMSQWLSSHGETVPWVANASTNAMPAMDHASMDHNAMTHDEKTMPGMLSAAQMDSLRASNTSTFDKNFLRFMIQHHEGALLMVKQLFGTPGAAQEPQIYGFATDVDNDQRAEINRMQTLLRTLNRKSAGQSRPRQ